MITVTRTFTVDVAPEIVIDYLKDFGHAEEWDPGTESCRRSDLGPIEVGATWHNVSTIAGVTTELTYRLEKLTGEEIVLIGRNERATSIDTITVRPSGAGSQITYRADIDLSGPARWAAPVVKMIFEKAGNDTRKQLGEALNALPGRTVAAGTAQAVLCPEAAVRS